MSSEDLRQLICDRVNSLGKAQVEIARSTGIEQASLSRFLSGKQSLSGNNILSLIDFIGLKLIDPTESENAAIRRVAPNAPVTPANEGDQLTISVYDVAGAGPGFNPVNVEPLCSVSAPAEYLRNSDFAVKVIGHSMEPLIANGSIVGVKTNAYFQANELYVAVIPYEGMVVKRVAVDIKTNEYIFKSINPDKEAYPDFRISMSDSEGIIVGRVVWVLFGY